MQIKNSLALITALTAGSAVARLHGHERRHHAHQVIEKRAVGDTVYATINGKLVSWINEWSGSAATAAAAAASEATSVVPSVVASATPAVSSVASSIPASSDDDSDWASTPADGIFSRDGFGEQTTGGGDYIHYLGNVGNPWGSNIIEVSAADAHKYQYVAKIIGDATEKWTVVFWNKFGPDGKLTGWYGNSALKFTLEPGEVRYVAFDSDSQGAWGAAPGDSLPVDQYGGYSCTWGEFDFGNSANNGWSGWDVSAIQAQAANQEVQGMKICDHLGDKCSIITYLAKEIINAYGFLERFIDGLGGNSVAGPVRLQVELNYRGDN